MPASFSIARHETTETMTLSRGFRSDAGNVRRTAVHVVAAVLVGAAMSATIWAGPAAAASGSRAQSRASASPVPARVKYYIVPKARNGIAPSLYAIAARTLGDGNLFTEIFNLNKGRLQPHGGRLENPQEILAGWVLELPADASGPGVHFGRLPGGSPPPAPPVSPRPSRPAADAPAAHRSPVSWAEPGGVIVVVIVVVAGLAGGHRRRHRRRLLGRCRAGGGAAATPGRQHRPAQANARQGFRPAAQRQNRPCSHGSIRCSCRSLRLARSRSPGLPRGRSPELSRSGPPELPRSGPPELPRSRPPELP